MPLERVHGDVARLQDELEPAADTQQPRERCEHRLVVAGHTPQERPPGEVDRRPVGDAAEHVGEPLDGGDHEQDVRHPVSPGQARAVNEPVGARVERDGERARVGAGELEREATVARADVDDRASVRPRQPAELTDVHLDEPSSGKRSHDQIIPVPMAETSYVVRVVV